MLKERVYPLREGVPSGGPVVYWMSRDQRVGDNWALIYSQKLASKHCLPLVVLFCLTSYLGAPERHYDFMLRGLREVEASLRKLSIPFVMLVGDPAVEVPRWMSRNGAGALVTDFSPLRIKARWTEKICRAISVPFFEVDAHNIVPCRVASTKREYAARTFRPRINSRLEEFLKPFPRIERHPFLWSGEVPSIQWNGLLDAIGVDRSVGPVRWIEPGCCSARRALSIFISKRLESYAARRNDPNEEVLSNLSPYLHFGQISAQRVALEVRSSSHSESAAAFLEELIVRRELSDNYCLYTPEYGSFEVFPDWARKTLDEHRGDERSPLYSLAELEEGRTSDPLWNATQRNMVIRGKMHGYLRMYWGKKILQWSKSPEDALEIAIWLNDRYELDGRDPGGYVGVAWCIGGLHDRAWAERPIFGKVRYMSYEGCRCKFDVDRYVRTIDSMEK